MIDIGFKKLSLLESRAERLQQNRIDNISFFFISAIGINGGSSLCWLFSFGV